MRRTPRKPLPNPFHTAAANAREAVQRRHARTKLPRLLEAMKPVTRRKPAATRTTAVRQPASTVKAAAAREPVRAALDRRIAKRRGSEPSSLAKAIVARHPSSRPAPVAKTGRRFGQLDFKKANAARKEQARCRR